MLDISRFNHGITAGLPIDYQGDILTEGLDQEKDFLLWCSEVSRSQYFHPFMDSLLKAQEREIVSSVTTEKALLCARAARHGVEIVREQFIRLDGKYFSLINFDKEVINRFEVM